MATVSADGGLRPMLDRVSIDRASLIVAGLIGTVATVLAVMLWQNVSAYGTFAFDMGIYDQAAWLLAHGHEPFMTVRGMNVWGHHVNLILYAFAPAYWLGIGGPMMLSLAQAASLMAGAVPLFLLARARTSRWTAVVVVFAYLLYPAVGWMARADFHPEVLSIGPTLWAAWFAHRRRWRWFAVAIAIVLSTREEAGIVVGMLGVVMILRAGWRGLGAERRARALVPGLVTAAVGAAWFLACTRVVIPRYLDGDPYYVNQFFGQWGEGMGGALVGMLTQPGEVMSVAATPPRPGYLAGMLGPLALLPALGLASLAAVPQLGINVLTNVEYAHSIHYQYNAFVVAPLFLGVVDAIALLRRWRRPRIVAPAVLAAATVVSSFSISAMPWARGWQAWWWWPDQRSAAIGRAVDLVPRDASVSASFRIVPALSRRTEIYDFPNPFIQYDWGINNEPYEPDRPIEWLVLETDTLFDAHVPLAESLIRGPDAPFEIVFEDTQIVAARRR